MSNIIGIAVFIALLLLAFYFKDTKIGTICNVLLGLWMFFGIMILSLSEAWEEIKGPFTSKDRLILRTVIVGAASLLSTSLSIYFIWGIFNWTWFKFSLLMSIITCLYSHFFWFSHINKFQKYELEHGYSPLVIVFVVMIVPLNILLFYPNEKYPMSANQEASASLIFVLEIVHGFAFYFLQKQIDRYLLSMENISTQ